MTFRWPTSTTRVLAAIETQLSQLNAKVDATMTALDNLQAADTALKAEVTTAITDWLAALNNANGANDPAIQAVADDMTAQVTALTAADPATPPVTQGP